MSRWKVLNRTSPSGKQLFECSSCGRVSPTPDKRCHVVSCSSYSPAAEAEARRLLDELTERFSNLARGARGA